MMMITITIIIKFKLLFKFKRKLDPQLTLIIDKIQLLSNSDSLMLVGCDLNNKHQAKYRR